MACNSFAFIQGSSTFRTNPLGQQIRRPRPRCAPLPRPVACRDECEIEGGYAKPYLYEAECLPSFLAYSKDGLAGEPLHTVRVTRSAPGAGAVFSIGTALSSLTTLIEGFLLRTQVVGSTGSCGVPPGTMTQHSIVLRQVMSDGRVNRLNNPQAILAESGRIVVVGSGQIDETDGTVVRRGPAIATIIYSGSLTACAPSAYVTVGNGDSSPEVTDEVYNDIQPDVYQSNTWLIASSGTIATISTALVRRIDMTSRLPLIAGGPTGTLTYVAIDLSTSPLADDSVTASVSLVTLTSMIVVGVHLLDGTSAVAGSLLWPVRVDLSNIEPWTATNYNDGTTGLLRLAASTNNIVLLKVLSLPSDVVYVAALAELDTAASLPGHATQVFKFTADTDPDLLYGTNGISTWFDGEHNSTRPNDAILAPGSDGNVVVVGNSINETTDVSGALYSVPGFAYLNVLAAVTDGVPALPVPFLIEFKDICSPSPGMTRVLINGLDGCGPLHWASTFGLFCASAGMIAGDTDFHVGCPSQPADLLTATVGLGCPARLINAGRTLIPVITTCCDGFVCVDAKCAPTVLQVKGPIVIGCDETGLEDAALPGSIRFNPDTATFEGFNGTAWVVFNTTP